MEIWTDHQNLQYFISAKKLNCRQVRWALFLSHFNFHLTHKSGHSPQCISPIRLITRIDIVVKPCCSGAGCFFAPRVSCFQTSSFQLVLSLALCFLFSPLTLIWCFIQNNFAFLSHNWLRTSSWPYSISLVISSPSLA